MARIGNETKLVLKLAYQKVVALRDSYPDMKNDASEWGAGYRKAFDDWNTTLAGIVLSLEGK